MTSLRNRRLAAIRLFLHSLDCASNCDPDQARDHARRTQHTRARTLVDTYPGTSSTHDKQWRIPLHEHMCPALRRGAICDDPDRHAVKLAGSELVKKLYQTVGEA
ncbi:MAG: hypothetical protein JWQ95_491 [Sphaerisporangium sp.]|jgi:hypothetical protein|nr:hypothetical protein [Sphaerisporangium sp.]